MKKFHTRTLSLNTASLAAALATTAAAALVMLQPVQAQPAPGAGPDARPGWGERHHEHGGKHHRGERGPGAFGGMGMMGMMGISPRALDAVNATPEQRNQIRAIGDAARKDLQSQREAGRTLHEQAVQILRQPNIDANAAEQLRQKMLAQHDTVTKRMLQAQLDAARVLTPEQRSKLADLAQERAKRMQERMQQRQGGAAKSGA